MSSYPDNFRFTKEHEWVSVEGGTGTMGITFHAQKELGDIVYVDLPKPGTSVEAGKTIDIGKLEWKPVRNGKQLWEIGYPNRTASEF